MARARSVGRFLTVGHPDPCPRSITHRSVSEGKKARPADGPTSFSLSLDSQLSY